MSDQDSLESLLGKIRECRVCQDSLPFPPRPIVRAGESARILIVGQAPGTRVHETGIPWNDPSGDKLRLWMNLDRDTFYDETKIAIAPAGFCYPGKGKSGDLPPRSECAPLWHPLLMEHLSNLQLILLVGSYAQKYYLNRNQKKTLSLTVRSYNEYLPEFFPMVHPSPRNKLWLKNNPWFEEEVVPVLQGLVRDIIL